MRIYIFICLVFLCCCVVNPAEAGFFDKVLREVGRVMDKLGVDKIFVGNRGFDAHDGGGNHLRRDPPITSPNV